jgi:ABC-type cobalamin/Fe3+-siderophores transport system ATPase subunit
VRVIEFRVENFRSIGQAQTIKLRSAHTVLVGANNAGKSSLLEALDWVLHRWLSRVRPDRHDYFDPRQPISITATVGDVGKEDREALYPVCSNKEQRGSLAKTDDPRVTITLTVTPLESDDADEDLGRPKLDLDLWGFPIRQKAQDRRAAVVRLLLVPPARKIWDELSPSRATAYRELMRGTLEASSVYEDLEHGLTAVNKLVGEAFEESKERLLLNARVVSFVEDIAFQLTKENDPTELLRALEILVTDRGRSLPLERLGTGTQSIIVIGMLEIALRARAGVLRVLAIEEPDAFLHPHGVRHVASLIKGIAAEPRSQVVLTTHSPSLLATLVPGEIVRVERRAAHTEVFQAKGQVADRDFIRRVNQDTAEMFFARRVVLVEGDTERFLLPPMSALVERDGEALDFARLGISVIPTGGKSGLVAYLRLLDEFGIEGMAILDNDFLTGPECVRLIKYLRGRGEEIDDADPETVRRELHRLHIAVLSKGEIEDYVPLRDVARLAGKSEAEVSQAVSTSEKTSQAFEKLLRLGKPHYAQALARYYEDEAPVPGELDRLIGWVAATDHGAST